MPLAKKLALHLVQVGSGAVFESWQVVLGERRHSIGHGRSVPGLCTGRPHFSEIMGLSRNVAQDSFPANEARPGAAITLTCGWIMWRLPPTRSSQGIESGCPDKTSGIDTPKLPGKIDCRQRGRAHRQLLRSRSATRQGLAPRNKNSCLWWNSELRLMQQAAAARSTCKINLEVENNGEAARKIAVARLLRSDV